MAKDLDVTYEDMRQASNHMNKEKARIDDKLDALKGYVDNLVESGYVTSKSSKAFQESFDDFKKGASQMMEGLEGLAKYLKTAADQFEQVDEQLAKATKG